MVPNHSSDEHDWFIKSVNRVDPYTDYYVWRDGKGPGIPPTNWVHLNSLFVPLITSCNIISLTLIRLVFLEVRPGHTTTNEDSGIFTSLLSNNPT